MFSCLPGLPLGLAARAAAPACALGGPIQGSQEAQGGSFCRALVQITHRVDGSLSKIVTVSVPNGVLGMAPLVGPGWTIGSKRGLGHDIPAAHLRPN